MPVLRQETDDPRDNLEKALPDELYFYAKSKGITDINRAEPAIIMRQKLRQRGIFDIPIPERILGQPTDWRNEWSKGAPSDPQPSITADQLLSRQWQEQQNRKPERNPVAELLVDQMTIQQLRRECKARGIKLDRKDNIVTLREKLRK